MSKRYPMKKRKFASPVKSALRRVLSVGGGENANEDIAPIVESLCAPSGNGGNLAGIENLTIRSREDILRGCGLI